GAEGDLVVSGWNDTGWVVPPVSLVDLFDGQVARSPGGVAVVDERVEWSYRELAAASDRVAAGLVGCGVGRGDLVGVVMERSVELAAGLLGVLRAGAGWVPVDTGLPVARVEQVLADAGVAVVVCSAVTRGVVPVGVRVVGVEDLLAAEPGSGVAPVRV